MGLYQPLRVDLKKKNPSMRKIGRTGASTEAAMPLIAISVRTTTYLTSFRGPVSTFEPSRDQGGLGSAVFEGPSCTRNKLN
jgi:hypothetical protein